MPSSGFDERIKKSASLAALVARSLAAKAPPINPVAPVISIFGWKVISVDVEYSLVILAVNNDVFLDAFNVEEIKNSLLYNHNNLISQL